MDQQFRDILAQISSAQGTFRESGEQAKALMETCLKLPDAMKMDALKAFLDVILRDTFNIVAARQYLNEFTLTVPSFASSLQKQIIPYILDKIQVRAISFEEHIFTLRERLAAELEKEHDWIGAAKVLVGIPLESGQKQYEKDVKIKIYLKIAQLFLEAEEFVEAENYVVRLGNLIDAETNERDRLQHSASFARIQDFKRKYIEASQRYYDLSRNPAVPEGEQKLSLSYAVNCILLAPVSQQRSRVMAVLIKDERSLDLPAYPFLQKVFDGKTIKRTEMESFAQTLQPYQRDAITPDGSRLLEQTVLEHNILSTKKYFRVASFEALSRLLDIPAGRLEKIMVNMVTEGRLHVKMNHITNAVTFEQEHALSSWDKKLEQICLQVNRSVDLIAARHPDWYEKTISS